MVSLGYLAPRSMPMSDEPSFRDLIDRVRARDEQAAAELVRLYEPTIRMAIRLRLSDPSLRRLLDSMDICQSVLANFFVRAASGQFELDTADQLVKLLVTMARNKLTNYALQQRAARRDQRRVEKPVTNESELVDPRPSPSQVVANQELLHECRRRMSEEERQLADLRASGHSWDEIAAEVGAKADTVRSRLTRALDRVAQELRLEE
jgi:RNA polymerase sigma factor (sigma-70 family)